ncbi:MAG: SGNH/GDSL hydrolase family protein [Actinomycetota bacterium]|nr:SGNH/GDSL hydrolase family protein [Actinomycetota bacterium]
MTWLRRVLVTAVALPVLLVALLVVEGVVARRGQLLERPPLELDARVGSTSGTVVWVGDSTAAGVGASSAATALPTVVAEGGTGDRELSVLARSGASVADVVTHQLPAVAGTDPDVVFVSVGANDVTHLTSLSDFERDYRRLVAGLPETAQVVLLGVPDMGAVPRFAQPLRAVAGLRGGQLDDVVQEAATETGAAYVDIAGETGPEMRSDTERFFAADRYHPSDAGYELWADAVLDVLPPAMLSG